MVERGGYDAVLCHGVLEYVDDPAEGVRTVVAALRPEGVLSLLAAGLGGAVLARALAGHFKEARQALDDPNGRWGEADPVPHRFTADQLAAFVEGAGLAVGAVHGVRVFADLVPGVLVDTEPGALDALLKLEAAAAELPAVPLRGHAASCARRDTGCHRGVSGLLCRSPDQGRDSTWSTPQAPRSGARRRMIEGDRPA